MMETDRGATEPATGYLAEVLGEAQRLLDAGATDTAVDLLDANIARAREALAFRPQGILQRALGDLHRIGGNFEAACAQYDQAVAALHEAGDAATEADALLRRGDAQRALQRIGAATQSYSAAVALLDTLDDARGAAHGEFLLAGMASGVHREIAEQHYTRAVELYEEAALHPRPDDPTGDDAAALPEAVNDPRLVDSRTMAAVAQRDLERLRSGPVQPPPSDAVVSPAAAAPTAVYAPSPRATRVNAPVAGATASAIDPQTFLLLGALLFGICGLVWLALQWSENAWLITGVLIVVAVGTTLALVQGSERMSLYLKLATAGVAGTLMLASGALPSLQSNPADSLAPAPPPLPLPRAAVSAPTSTAVQRAALAEALQAAEADGDVRRQADVLRDAGELERDDEQPQQALELWTRAFDLYAAAAQSAPAAAVAVQLGDAFMHTQRPEPARQRFDAAARLYREVRDAPGYGHAVRRRGDAEAALQRWPDAQASYGDALTLAQRLADPNGEIRLTVRLAATQQALGHTPEARALLDKALRLSNDAGTPMQARVWLAVANFEASLDRDGPALRAYERAVTLAGAARDARLEARAFRSRGDYERRRGKLAIARGTYEVAIRLAHARDEPSAEALCRVHAAELAIQMRDFDTARDQYAGAQALYEEQPQLAGAPRVALGLGDLEASLNQADAAQAQYLRGLDLATRSSHVGLQIDALERLTKLLLASEPAAADEYLQRAAALRAEAFGSAAPHAAA